MGADHGFRALSAPIPGAVLIACGAMGCGEAPRGGDGGKGQEGAQAALPSGWTGLIDEATERGLDYENRSGAQEKATVLEANGAGVAAIDLEADGDIDLVFGQGLASLQQLLEGPGADLEVFLNDGTGRFSRGPAPGLWGWWNGLATGDVDGDGDQDLVAGGFGALLVLLQGDDGRLAPGPGGDLMPADPASRLVPGAAREKGRPPLWVSSLALFDADRDGHLDLYVGHYLELDPLAPPIGMLGSGPLAVPCRWKGYPVFCGPRGMTPQRDRILRGKGDGTFEERTAQWLEGEYAGYTLGVLPFDSDGDGDTDLFVAADSSPSQLLINDGQGRFTDVAYSAGVALSQDGAALASMGVASGDVDRDGRPDFAVTNFSGQMTVLYRGVPRGFENETFRMGLARETRSLLSWGVHLADFDGDGWLELFTANGHVYPQADLPNTGTSYAQPATLWKLGPKMRAERVEPSGPDSLLAPLRGSRGSALGDFDLDGAPDLALVRIDGPVSLGMNRGTSGAHRLALRCLGPLPGDATGTAVARTPADGMGTRVVVVPSLPPLAGPGQEFGLLAEVQTAAGYQSASTPWLHFGLGSADGYSLIKILWPSGRVEQLGPGAADRRLTVREGRGVIAEEALP